MPVYPVRQTDTPTEEEVTELVDRYFDSLERLFEEKKAEADFQIRTSIGSIEECKFTLFSIHDMLYHNIYY